LGHVLGLRHEHTRLPTNECYEDFNWRALTEYDSASIMHYPQCEGTNQLAKVLTELDCQGIGLLYQAPCSAAVTETGCTAFYQDGDGDGYGYEFRQPQYLWAASGHYKTKERGDCDDFDQAINPAASEVCNKKDDDCDWDIDEGFDKQNDPDFCNCMRCSFPKAVPACKNGVCAIGSCLFGWVDLDKAKGNGCEYQCAATGSEICDHLDNDCDGAVDEGISVFSDPSNCGQCGNRCAFANATAACVAGSCAMTACVAGYHDINDDPADGCEYACLAQGSETCNGQDDDCDGEVDDGFAKLTDVDHCGSCDPCSVAGAVPECNQGVCDIASCLPGFVDLDGDAANGCEYACSPDAAAELCDGADNDCDGAIDEDFDARSDEENCGGCGRRCEIANASATCANGDCVIATCDSGFHDLDGDVASGCEYACSSSSSSSVDETCNGLDDDCDGSVDEDVAGMGGQCGSAEGACEPGTLECVGGRVECVGGIEPASFEVCNDLDDDCDGSIDEGFAKNAGVCLCDGDQSGDGEISPVDALIVFRCYLSIGPCSACADVDDSGAVSPADALCLFNNYLGRPSCLDD
ncbi:MAG: MopE-related protein, partial [Pseudomonadota bacterium]